MLPVIRGGSELDIKANSGDTVRWTVSTFDGDTDYTAFLYNGSFNPSASITALSYFNMHTSVYLPSGSDPVNGTITAVPQQCLCDPRYSD